MTLRIFINIALLVSIFYLPWWATTFIVLFGIFIFKNFYEAVLAGFLMDILYGTKTIEFMNIWFIFTAFYFLIYILITAFKKNIRFYESG